jgi:hypothetical protein
VIIHSCQAGISDVFRINFPLFRRDLILEHKPGFNRAASLVGVCAGGPESGTRRQISNVDEREVSSKEEGILDPSGCHGE